ncbi:MAG: hypothetical protein RL308_1670 [Bacteroidota bacterium]|jgi:transcriptional regulator with XRE-family HTH domain
MEQREVLLHLAKKVKQLRIEKGVTQEQMYNDTGIHVARIEQGKRDISFTTLVKIAGYFEKSLGEFDPEMMNESN